jgi:hypothetical protein
MCQGALLRSVSPRPDILSPALIYSLRDQRRGCAHPYHLSSRQVYSRLRYCSSWCVSNPSHSSAFFYRHPSYPPLHADLKPENLLFRTKSSDADIMIADFGLSRVMDANKFSLLTEICGTPGVSQSIYISFAFASGTDSDRILTCLYYFSI